MAEQADEVLDDRALNESMDDTIRQTLGEINARNAGSEESAQVQSEAATTAPASEQDTGRPVADTRTRDETGKFAKQDKPAAPETAPQSSPENAAPAPVAAAPTDTPAIDLNRPPSSWKPAAKAQWAALPKEAREEIYRRENSIHANFGEMKPMADFGKVVRDKFEPYKMIMAAEGATPEQGIDEYLRTAALFRVGTPQQKMGMLYQIDKTYNCGFQQEFDRLVTEQVKQQVARITGQPAPQQAAQPAQPQQFQDPRVDALLQSQEQEKQRRAQELSAQATDAENAFRSAMDNGQPKYPFVDNVEQDMINRIPEIRRLNPALPQIAILEKAYEAAVWANPETRAVLLSQQQAQTASPADTQRRVEAARRASSSNVPKRGALPSAPAIGHLQLGTAESDESIRETYRQLNSTH